MPPFDAGAVLAAISDDMPCGPDLEFDPAFVELERAAQGKPEQQFGSTIIPGEDPDWKEVEKLASGLLERSRDLRVLAHLAAARLRLSGLPGFSEVVVAIRDLLQTRWESVHPLLDAEEDNDPTMRANALLRIGQVGPVLKVLRTMPLAQSPRVGQFGWREVQQATGAMPPDPGTQAPSEANIRGAFKETDNGRLVALRQAAVDAVDAAKGIGAVFDEQAGYGTSPDLDELIKLLREITKIIERYGDVGSEVAAEAAAEEVAEVPADDGGALVAGVAAPGARGGVVTAQSLTEVTTRADAVRLLDLVCKYYERYEPSSPLPLLIDRARNLADKNFFDVLRDLAPDGLTQAQSVILPRDG